MRIQHAAGGLALGLLLSMATALSVTTTAGAAEDRRADPSTAAAARALAAAQGSLAGITRTPTRDATMALRDLWLAKDALEGADAAAARRLLGRPTDRGDRDYYGRNARVKRECGPHVCVHWVTRGEDASRSAFASKTLKTVESVHRTYVGAGYKAPLKDQGQGGNRKRDVYLAQIGDEGLYGYCTSDATRYVEGRAVWAYCVLDNDYARSEFPTNTPLQNMRVTAAHEYFHAVQFAYDVADDTWIYETTATWAEDEVFDEVDDSRLYLPFGQMGDPAVYPAIEDQGPAFPIDLAGNGFTVYGNWIFMRYLSEQHPEAAGGMPVVVRDIWRALDTTKGSRLYSMRAVGRALSDIGTTTELEYAAFAVANNRPADSYEEGAHYPLPARLLAPVVLSPGVPATARTVTMDHMTSATGVAEPFSTGWSLEVDVDMAPPTAGSRAAVVVFPTSGEPTTEWISLDADGNGGTTAPFSSDAVDRVEVTLANGSTAMVDCGTDDSWRFSCAGFGEYDDQSAEVSFTAVN